MDDGIRERALTFNLESQEIECPHAALPGFHPEPCADCTVGNLVDFASSEADRRERECIERAAKMWCIWCDADSVPATRHENPSPARWFHDMEDHGLKECEADEIREWSYQREQGGK